MWTTRRIEAELDELAYRQVIREINDLMCGYSGEASVNRAGIDLEIWKKLLRRGGVSDEGIEKLLHGESISQRDTVGAFQPYTAVTIHSIAEGEDAVLTAEELDHVLQRVLAAQGRLPAEQ